LVSRMCPNVPFADLWNRQTVSSIAEFQNTDGRRRRRQIVVPAERVLRKRSS
jgi:hypothetical protein